MLTLKAINKELKRLGYHAELVKGHGYYYFDGSDVEKVAETACMVYTLNQLTFNQWLKELDRMIASVN